MRKRAPWIVGGIAVVLLVAAWQLGLLSSDPEEANLADAIAAEQDDDSGESDEETDAGADTTTSTTIAGDASPIDVSATTEAAPAALADATNLDGTWAVKLSDGTFAGYRIDEILSGVGFTAVGRTREVSGHLVASGSTIETVEISVDLLGLTSDSRFRDSQLKSQALETEQFPFATFVLSEPIAVDAAPLDGTETTFDAVGQLTVHGVTNDVTIPLEATTADGLLFVVGGVEVALVDYDIDTPSAPRVAGVSDVATMEFSLVFAP
jgi:polyisoprenoid-binding protein YceI